MPVVGSRFLSRLRENAIDLGEILLERGIS